MMGRRRVRDVSVGARARHLGSPHGGHRRGATDGFPGRGGDAPAVEGRGGDVLHRPGGRAVEVPGIRGRAPRGAIPGRQRVRRQAGGAAVARREGPAESGDRGWIAVMMVEARLQWRGDGPGVGAHDGRHAAGVVVAARTVMTDVLRPVAERVDGAEGRRSTDQAAIDRGMEIAGDGGLGIRGLAVVVGIVGGIQGHGAFGMVVEMIEVFDHLADDIVAFRQGEMPLNTILMFGRKSAQRTSIPSPYGFLTRHRRSLTAALIYGDRGHTIARWTGCSDP